MFEWVLLTAVVLQLSWKPPHVGHHFGSCTCRLEKIPLTSLIDDQVTSSFPTDPNPAHNIRQGCGRLIVFYHEEDSCCVVTESTVKGFRDCFHMKGAITACHKSLQIIALCCRRPLGSWSHFLLSHCICELLRAQSRLNFGFSCSNMQKSKKTTV